MPKNYFDFSLFDEIGDAMDLFANTVRKAYDYNSLEGKTFFNAIVLTNPIPMNLGQLKSFVPQKGNSVNSEVDTYPKFTFKARIIGPNSPHQFLPDPCNQQTAKLIQEQQNIQDVLDMHTTVVAYGATQKPSRGDLVKIRVESGTFSIDVQNAEFVSLVTSDRQSIGDFLGLQGGPSNCDQALEALFTGEEITTLSDVSINILELQALIDRFETDYLPIIQDRVSPKFNPPVISSDIRTTEQGRMMIWDYAKSHNISTSVTREQIKTNPTEAGRLRVALKNQHGFDIAQPEKSNHNPAKLKGKVAIDLQSVGNDEPSYLEVKRAVDDWVKYDSKPELDGFRITKVHPEPNNGTRRCPPKTGPKCGVVHIELEPTESILSSGLTSTEGDAGENVSENDAASK